MKNAKMAGKIRNKFQTVAAGMAIFLSFAVVAHAYVKAGLHGSILETSR